MAQRLRRILGLTRIRNEACIIHETLDHFAKFCDLGVVVFDDASQDATPELVAGHPAVVDLIRNFKWNPKRPALEGQHRQMLLDRGRSYNPHWFLYFDADERIEWDFKVPKTADFDAVAMKLWDAYITREDQHEIGCHRKWFGPEWREIVFLFRNVPKMKYGGYDQRNIAGFERPLKTGFVKHYGKAVSVREWEETCVYYQLPCWGPDYNRKWKARMGRAVHTHSDFGHPLVSWSDAKEFRFDRDYMIHGLPPVRRRKR